MNKRNEDDKMKHGKLIVMEGSCDGVGKSTQIELLRKRLLKALEKRNEPAFKITGAFEYALQKHDGKQVLFKRSFAASTIYSLYLKNPICAICGEPIKSLYDIEGDHIIPWIKGGLTEENNCQIVHKICNLKKGIKC